MIRIEVEAKDNYVESSFKKEKVVLNDIGLVMFELERIKREILDIEIEPDMEFKGE